MLNTRMVLAGTALAAILVGCGAGRADGAGRIRVLLMLPSGPRLVGECRDLPAAQARARALKQEGGRAAPVEVVLDDGVYTLTAPLSFTPEDSGTKDAPITYRAAPPGRVTISGGLRITGWRDAGNGVWSAAVPAVRAGNLYFRQLFVNDRRAVPARSPNRGFFYTTGLVRQPEYPPRRADGFYYANGDLTEAMAAYPDTLITAYQSWLAHQYRVKELRPDTRAALMATTMDIVRPRSRYIVENAPSCLDAPGEWHLDRATGVLRYLPLPGEDPRKCTFTAPALPTLVTFRGDPEKGRFVEHLRFRGLTFAHADWTPEGNAIKSAQAHIPNGAAPIETELAAGAVAAIGLRDSSFEECEVVHTGSHAVVLLQGCTGNTLRKCHLHDLGGGGVYILWEAPLGGNRFGWKPRGDYDTVTRNEVDNCFIHDMTHVFRGSVGILLGPCAAYNRVTHNEISHGDYTGISVGWGWTAREDALFQEGNVVEYNHIHHVMNYLLDDGGGIYTPGAQKGARICRNWIHDIHHDPLGHGAKGIYPDEGSAGILFEGNVVHDVGQGFGGNGGHACVVRNNIFAFCEHSGMIGGSRLWAPNRKYNPAPLTFEGNILFCDKAPFADTAFLPGELVSRNNLYWAGDPTDRPGFQDAERTLVGLAAWQRKGFDAGSLLADPLFVNAAKRDLRLRRDSPALRLGFVATDLSRVGLYGAGEWTSLPARMVHAPIRPDAGPDGFEWTYEDEAAGLPPVHSGALAPGPADLKHRIEVTDADAASGRRCLKVVEGSDQGAGYFPFLYYPVGAESGPVRATFRLKMPAATPSALYVSFRDYRNHGGQEFRTGPKIQIDAAGILSTADGKASMPLPRDVWASVEIAFAAGKAAKTFRLTVSLPGQAPRVFPDLPFEPEFMDAGQFYIVSTGPAGGVFLLDDVRVQVGAAGG